MADFLVIDGTPVEIAEGSGEEVVTRTGDSGRALNADYLEQVIAEKREWPSLVTKELTTGQKNALVALLSPGPKTITGEIVSDFETQCYVQRDRVRPIWNGSEVLWTVAFKMIEA